MDLLGLEQDIEQGLLLPSIGHAITTWYLLVSQRISLP